MFQSVTVAKCLEFAMKTEEIGAELYGGLAKRFASDRELCELFEGLGRDEAQHGELFRALQARVVPGKTVPVDQQDYLRAMAMSEVFSGNKGLARDVEGIRSRDDALERALNLEKATLAYYQAMREVLGADDVLDSLIAVEKRHVVKVMQLLLTGAKFRGLADSF
jgi:rubrerythrin